MGDTGMTDGPMAADDAKAARYRPDTPAAHYWYARATTAPWLPLMPAAFALGILVGMVVGAPP